MSDARGRLGPLALWRRWRLRRRILDSAPLAATDDERCEVHALAGSDDWLEVLWALKSFYRASARRYRLCVHDDGSLDDEQLGALTAHLPGARILAREQADRLAAAALVDCPRLTALRTSHRDGLRLVDVALTSQAPRVLLLDPMVLCFEAPLALLGRIENADFRRNACATDLDASYLLDGGTARTLLGVQLLPFVSGRLALLQAGTLVSRHLEALLNVVALTLQGPPRPPEQALRAPEPAVPERAADAAALVHTLFALACCEAGAELLPGEYALYLDAGLGGRPLRCYGGAARALYYREGLPALCRAGLLAAGPVRGRGRAA